MFSLKIFFPIMMAGLLSSFMFSLPFFSSALSPSLLFTLGILFVFSPTPLFFLSVSLGASAVLFASASAGIGILIFSLFLGHPIFSSVFSYLLWACLPAYAVGRIALRHRPSKGNTLEGEANVLGYEWYPEGRILVTLCGLGAIFTLFFLFNSLLEIRGTLKDLSFEKGLTLILTELFQDPKTLVATEEQTSPPSFFIFLFPFLMAAFFSALLYLNFRFSHGMARFWKISPRPISPFSRLQFPASSLGYLGVIALLCFLPGDSGFLGRLFCGSAVMALAVLGLSCLHAILEGHPWQGGLLMLLYFSVFILGFFLLIPLAIFGVIDLLFKIREKHVPFV